MQWTSLTLGEPPSWSGLTPVPGKYDPRRSDISPYTCHIQKQLPCYWGEARTKGYLQGLSNPKREILPWKTFKLYVVGPFSSLWICVSLHRLQQSDQKLFVWWKYSPWKLMGWRLRISHVTTSFAQWRYSNQWSNRDGAVIASWKLYPIPRPFSVK